MASTLALAMGLVFLAAARISGNPTAYGLVVFVGILFVAIACAMHVSAALDGRFRSGPAAWRLVAKVGIWLLVGGGTAWLIGRAPGEEVLIGLLAAPLAVGIAGLLVAHDNRWPAVAFLAVAGLLAALIASVLVARHAA
ncbi:MAG: hypothetical protein ACRDFY_02715 [Candidatus Limnocylindria bacterium]